ncbi:hypothetical protein AX774_g7027 [Zancudomyces culisetae]|uniref:Uncharacterized protein n=1 Tax=Zancudomyces culisetae TaxID=1213189 RepID=A0A1R1PFB0_ZANCU|nr:hypothetical protein AX774_g7027 [Zancudomyces culisetae]|eukprot:OMH79552.1 hypothetical protein AX774_g7027 [Zancudomyces culisetae]
MAVNSLASFLELGEETTGLNRKGDSKKNRLLNNTISENAAGILVKLVTSDPDLYYGFYNEFMNLSFQLQSATSNSPLRAKVRMATIPLILQIKTKISDRRDYKQRVELIQKYIAPSVNQHLGLNAFLDEPSNFYNQVGLLTEDGGFVEQRKILEVQCYTLRKMVECISENSAAVVSLGDEYDFFTDVFASQTCYDLVYSILRLIRVLHSAFNPNGIAPKTFIEFLEKHVYSTDTDAVANQECRYLYNFLFSVTEHCYTSLGVLINHGTLYNTDVFAYFTHALFENISYLPLNVAKNIISKVVLSNIRPHVSLSTNKEDISTAQLRSSCIYSYLFPLLKHYKDLLLTNNCYVDTYASLPDVVVFYRSFSDLIINLLKFLNCGFIRFENFEKTILSMSQFDYSNKFSILSAPEFPTEQVNLPIALCFVNHQDMLPLLLETISVLIRFKDSSLVLKLVTQVNLNISINVPLSSMLSTSHIQRLVSFDAHNILDSLSSYFCHRFLIDLCSLLFDSYHYELIDFVYNSISDLVYTALITKRFRSLDLLPEDCDSEMFTNKYIESVGTTFLQTNMLPVSKVNDLFIYYSNSQHDQKKRRAKLKLMLSNVDGINRNNKLLQDSLSFTKIPSAASNKYNYGHASALSYNIDSILPF